MEVSLWGSDTTEIGYFYFSSVIEIDYVNRNTFISELGIK